MHNFDVKHSNPSKSVSRTPMFRSASSYSQAEQATDFFFNKASAISLQRKEIDGDVIQRQEGTTSSGEEEEKKEPIPEGLKTTGKQLLKNPKFKAWYEPRLDLLEGTLWDNRGDDEKAALVTFGVLSLGLAGFAFSQSPELRELLSGVDIGTPLGWIPYSPIEGFKYTLPKPGKSNYGFGADFTFNPYLERIGKRYPSFPLTGATFGLESSYEKGSGLSLTGGKFGLEFLGGGLSVEGKTFKSLSPYPQMILGNTPTEPPAWLMQSIPGMPNIQTGPGFQIMLKADILKLIK